MIGASGYTGAETLRLLAQHPEVDAVHVTAQANAGAMVGSLFPSLAPAYPALQCATLDPGDLDGLDVAFMALPHGESQRHMGAVVERVGHVVDIGADFRLPAPAYERWYGEVHEAPHLLDTFSFGLPELFREEIRARRHVANPGCYPTAVSLALAPLVAGGLVKGEGLIADALSGVSGAGRSLAVPSLFSEANESARAYGLLTHRHTAEMELALAHAAGRDVEVLFTPHVVPMTRGILATCYARPSAGAAPTTPMLLECFREFYREEPFVTVVDEPPATKAATGSNSAFLTVRADERTGAIVALAAIDNLVKGASGQAIQNANILLGLPEGMGLPVAGIMP